MNNSVTLFHRDIDGTILMVSRKDNHNDFGLPGGKVEDGESLENALIREVYEETGIIVSNPKLIFEMDDGCSYYNYTYTADLAKADEFIFSEPHVVKYGTIEDLLNGSFKEYNKRLLEHLKIS